ncbi:hypothetical protein HMPREF0083_04350 [Aneurinibacillus aneurinilyticus ATCC 12856]|uniref:Uncharacterized protein n=1 Tax=Aneurinibacillus aneurinilyticus ATCC 12856 TaxID=649747 RepID=U1WXZ2_ANEAE|nr:hypothetical protein HMPREF0083_04350 [Aneurinibacillus aneurinilyticus ATCC 12856]
MTPAFPLFLPMSIILTFFPFYHTFSMAASQQKTSDKTRKTRRHCLSPFFQKEGKRP